MLLIYSHSTCVVSKECLAKTKNETKYNKNTYAKIGTICKYFGYTASRNILQYRAIIGCDATSFFYINERINPRKELFKNSSCLGLIE